MDAPWTPIYLAVLFLLHPWLGILGIVFSLILASMAWVSHRMSHASIEAAQEAGGQVGGYIHSKLRNAEVIEAMGMLNNLRPLESTPAALPGAQPAGQRRVRAGQGADQVRALHAAVPGPGRRRSW
jgi:ABC-type protease/lipase transport system fused ATPase/permease subunit